MANSKIFGGVTEAIFECVKTTSEKQHGTVYTSGNQGTATTHTPVGEVIVGFDFVPAKDTITYTIQKKPFIVSSSQIWDGIQETIDGCGG